MTAFKKADAIRLSDFKTAPMRAFHMTWFAFFLCFFGWFGIAPLMAVVREELKLTPPQIGNIMIASVAITIVARLAIGWLCDRIGPRIAYTVLLALGALPVMGIGLAHDYTTFLMFRLAIGAIGASFVVTQYHTSVMFEPRIVGQANAMAAGWGNLGGGVTQMVMPLLFGLFLGFGFDKAVSWRLTMVVPGVALLVAAVLYYTLTQDTPAGNFAELRRPEESRKAAAGTFLEACRDTRVWALFVLYGACFGVELTIDNIAALYFRDTFQVSLQTAGLLAGTFGMMNLFARALGGWVSDKVAAKRGLNGRVALLGMTILAEGVMLMAFSQARQLGLAVASLLVCGLFVKMSNGATYAVVPFLNRRALGSVAGIVGAGGNAGAVAAGFLFKTKGLSWQSGLLILGCCVAVSAVSVLAVRFGAQPEAVSGVRMEPVGVTAGD